VRSNEPNRELLSTPQKYTYVGATEHCETCSEQPDSKTYADDRHHNQRKDLPLASTYHSAL
jgi:hypothetical protein